jgi:flagellar protein FlgJ
MFTRMMLKSMRDAVGPDPMFGSDQEQMYQGMADDQLSVQLSKGHGFGLADMLLRQLHKMGVKGADAAGTAEEDTAATRLTGPAAGGALAAYSAVRRASGAVSKPTTAAASDTVKANFVQALWPDAQKAGGQLGIDAQNLIAQAALETNWGRNLPQDSAGRSSNNLFGVKVSPDWTGASVSAATREYEHGQPASTQSAFRAYGSRAESFQDYVALVRGNSRYSAALNTSGDVQAFAAGLQRGGYATDPDYASKITALAHIVSGSLGTGAAAGGLKLAGTVPITRIAEAPSQAVNNE